MTKTNRTDFTCFTFGLPHAVVEDTRAAVMMTMQRWEYRQTKYDDGSMIFTFFTSRTVLDAEVTKNIYVSKDEKGAIWISWTVDVREKSGHMQTATKGCTDRFDDAFDALFPAEEVVEKSISKQHAARRKAAASPAPSSSRSVAASACLHCRWVEHSATRAATSPPTARSATTRATPVRSRLGLLGWRACTTSTASRQGGPTLAATRERPFYVPGMSQGTA